MTSPHDDREAALAEEMFLELARAAISDEEKDRVWEQLIGDSPLPKTADDLRDQAFREASLALRIARGELTLGRYMSELRSAAKLSWQQLGSSASLAGQLIGELEADQVAIKSIEPSRLGRIAARVHATRRVFLTLTAAAIVRPAPGGLQPRLTRLDTPSPIESERAVRRSPADATTNQMSDDEYLTRVASAYDAEMEQRPRPSTR